MTYGFTFQVNGASGIATMKAIEAEMARLGVKANIETKEVSNHFEAMHVRLRGIFSGIKGIFLSGLGISALFEGFEFIKASKEAFDKLEESVVKVKTVISSTGGSAGISNEGIQKQAATLSKSVVNSRASILDMQATLLSFTGIKAPIFEKVSKAVLDFSTFKKIDISSGASALGKALNDPIQGMNLLRRTGVILTAQQKEQITNYQKAGQLAKAQGVIISELQKRFGGQSEAFAGTDEGKILMAKKRWSELKLAIGETVSKLQVAVIPLFIAMMNGLSLIIKFFQSNTTWAIIFKDTILVLTGALITYGAYLAITATWTGIVTAATWLWNAALAASPITWVVLGVIALITVFAILWDKFKGFREFVGGVFGFISQWVMTLIHVFTNLGTVIGDIFSGNFKKAYADAKTGMTEFGKDIGRLMGDSIKDGAAAAGKSTFKFGNLFGFGNKQEGASDSLGKGLSGGTKQAAINTSELSGAKGGLGEARVINIKIETLQKNVVTGTAGIKENAQAAVEVLLRTINNVSYSQSGTF